MITLRKQRQKANRNSLLVTGTSRDALVQIALSRGCFNGKDIGSLGCKDSLGIYNFLCSLLAYALRALSANAAHAASIVVLIDGTQVPVKVLRVVLRACQNALAYKIKQAIVLEPDRFLDQQKISLDLLLEAYDFKTTVCSKSKLWKYVNVADLAEHFGAILTGGWIDIRSNFEKHFTANPIYISADKCVSLVENLARLTKKDQSIFIELSNKTVFEPYYRDRSVSSAAGLPRVHRNERQNTLPAKASFYETDVFGAYPNDANTNPEQQSASVHGSVDLNEHQRKEKVNSSSEATSTSLRSFSFG
ncbi:Protein F55D12.2 a [Aphelenchoides avenae]|nr:Protein F55D12.2 a [Aphelenchus avenae]